MIRRIRKLSRRAKAVFAVVTIAAASAGVLIFIDDRPDGQGTQVLGSTEERSSGVEVASGAQPASAEPDTTPPTITFSVPANGGSYRAATWTGCSPAGLCGSAFDPSGVNKVEVSVLQQSSGKYWDGSAFASSSAVFRTASGINPWALALPLPGDGTYTASVQASDLAGNATPANERLSATFTVDTVAPPAPSITTQPDDVTFDTNAEFEFDDTEAGVTFLCQLDGTAPAGCQKNSNFQHLSETDHALTVWALDAAGNQSGPATWAWTVLVKKRFGVDGDAAQKLYPGGKTGLDVTVSNPFKVPLRVLEISASASGPSGCSAADNLKAAPSSFTGPVVIPANSSRSLSALGIPSEEWPQLEMFDHPTTSQDSCKNVTFKLTYEATGTKA